MKKIAKFLKYTNMVLMPLIGLALVMVIYYYSYSVVHFVDSDIFNLYSTQGKYHYNPFLSNEINEKTDIYATLYEHFEITNVNRIQDIFKSIAEDKEMAKSVLEKNKEYMLYLKEENLNLDDFFNYIDKIMKLDENIINGAFYFVVLSIIVIYAVFYKFRIGIYISGAIVYLLSNLGSFTDELSSYFIITIMKMLGNEIDINVLSYSFFSAFKEAILTYIILDVVFEEYSNKKEDAFNHNFKKFYYSIKEIITYYERNSHKLYNVKFKRINIPMNQIQQFLIKNKQDYYCKKILECVTLVINIQNNNEIIVKNELFVEQLKQIIRNIDDSYKLRVRVY